MGKLEFSCLSRMHIECIYKAFRTLLASSSISLPPEVPCITHTGKESCMYTCWLGLPSTFLPSFITHFYVVVENMSPNFLGCVFLIFWTRIMDTFFPPKSFAKWKMSSKNVGFNMKSLQLFCSHWNRLSTNISLVIPLCLAVSLVFEGTDSQIICLSKISVFFLLDTGPQLGLYIGITLENLKIAVACTWIQKILT